VISDVLPDPAGAEINVSGRFVPLSSNPSNRLRTTVCGRGGGIVIFALISGALADSGMAQSSR
jgi:hypothetical protein